MFNDFMRLFLFLFLQDEKLKGVVERTGEVWETVASYFEDRSDVQCQHRWTKVVNPQLVKGPWTKEVKTAALFPPSSFYFVLFYYQTFLDAVDSMQ